MATPKGSRVSDVLCIGAGASGICLGARLYESFPHASYHIYERELQIGGTWYINQYPGIACDIPAHFYSFSFALRPEWKNFLASGSEVLQYLNEVARNYGVDDNVSCGCEVVSCEWNEASTSHSWSVTVRSVETGEEWTHKAKAVFAATGYLSVPKDIPQIPGMEEFRGQMFHSAKWPANLETRGKDIVVVGNGSTGVQIVPALAKNAKSITQVFNSKHWSFPMNFQYPISRWTQWAFKYIPFALRLNRLMIFLTMEQDAKFFDMGPEMETARKQRRTITEHYMRSLAPEEYHKMLIPDFPIGCKRRLVNNGYYESLHQENVTLAPGPIASISRSAIHTAEGSYNADIIVFAIGFKTNIYIPGVQITGRGKATLEETWAARGCLSTYQGTAVSGFPNFFMIMGPNSITGYTSALLATENHINHALKILKPVLNCYADAVEVKEDAEREYTTLLHAKLEGLAYNASCGSYHIAPDGRNYIHNPWGHWYQFWESIFPAWNRWNVRWNKKAVRRSYIVTLAKILATSGLVTGIYAYYVRGSYL